MHILPIVITCSADRDQSAALSERCALIMPLGDHAVSTLGFSFALTPLSV